jgi:hypothetical protein
MTEQPVIPDLIGDLKTGVRHNEPNTCHISAASRLLKG